MNKKYGIFYNKQFNVLIVNFNSEASVQLVEQVNDLTILKKDNEIIGINIFNIDSNLNLINGLYSEDSLVVDYVQKRIKSIIDVQQEVQLKIGKVLTCENIEGTHLNKTTVDIDEVTPIVCGAKNIAAGQIVVVATIGTYMLNGMKIVAGKLHDNDSFGMICSASELGIKPGIFNDYGVIELPLKYESKIGKSFWKEFKNAQI